MAKTWVKLRPGATINYRTPIELTSSQYAVSFRRVIVYLYRY